MRCSHFTALLVPLALACLFSPPARASGERVVSVEICRDVQNRRGVGCGDRFPADVGQLHVLLAVRVPPGTSGKVQTVWRWGGQVAQRQNLNIRFDRPGGYRTRARQRISRTWTGAWSLEVLDADGRSLTVRRFTVGEGANQGADTDFAEAPPSDEQPPEDEEDGGQPDAGQPDAGQPDAGQPDAGEGAGARPDDGEPAGAADAADVQAPAAAAPPPARIERPVDTIGASAAEPGDGRRQGALMLLVGGLLLFIAGVVIVRRRSGRAKPPPGGGGPTPHDPPSAPPAPPVAAAGDPGATPIPSSPEATDALQRLADLVTELWSRWVAATGGSPQRALNAAWRAVPDPGRLGLDHIRLCNALESAAQDYAAIPPRGTSADILRIRLYAQAPALIGVACSLAVECERLGLDGVGLELAFNPWGGRAGLTSTVLAVLDDGAAALGTSRLSLLPYETKVSAASRMPGADVRPFPLPEALAERLGAGNRIVRVESAPFADGPPPVVWSLATS